jgi:hypothetical protein
VKTTFTVAAVILLMTACSRQADGDAALRAKIIGTWTTAGVVLPDQARVSHVTSIFHTDGSWISRYTISRAGSSRDQTTSGTWQIEKGFMIELQTNVDGVVDTTDKAGGSKIVRLDSHEMVLSNYYSPRRVFIRKE